MPKALQADERDANDEIQRRVGASLTQRRNTLGLLEQGAAKQDSEDVTRVFQSFLPQKGAPDTVRPQASADDPPAPELPKAPKVAGHTSWQDEPTRVERAAASASLQPVRVSAPPKPTPPPERSHKSRVFWLVGLGLLATLSVAWWATSATHAGPALSR